MSALSSLNNAALGEALFANLAGEDYVAYRHLLAEDILLDPDPDGVVFNLLFPRPDLERQAIDAVNEFTGVRIREDGFYRRIMPPMSVTGAFLAGSPEMWAAMGVPPDSLNPFGGANYVWEDDFGASPIGLAEMAARYEREEAEYLAGLAAPAFTRDEYRSREVLRARHARHALAAERYRARDARFLRVFSGVVSDILAHAGSGETT